MARGQPRRRLPGTLGAALAALCLAVTVPLVTVPAHGDAGLRGDSASKPIAEGGLEWRQFHNTSARTGFDSDVGTIGVDNVDHLGLKYASRMPASIPGSPVVAGGLVYFGATDGTVRGVDAATGAVRWSYATRGVVESTPSVVGDVLYVGSNDGYLYALSAATGAFRWKAFTGGPVFMASPLVANGLVYIGSNAGDFIAFDAQTGAKIWSRYIWKVRGAAAAAGGIVYVGSDQKKLWALDAETGVTRWTASTGALIGGTPSVSDGVVFVGSDDFHLYAYDAETGARRWKAGPFPNSGIVRSSPAVAYGLVYVGTSEGTKPGNRGGHMWAIDVDTGATMWKQPTVDMCEASAAVINGVVIQADYADQLYAFDATTGEKLWASGFTLITQLGRESPVVAGGVVYITGQDGRLYAFEVSATPVGDLVSIHDSRFDPSTVSAHVIGRAVQWSNEGTVAHTVTDVTGMNLFDSGSIPPGGSFTFGFAGAGQYRYVDTLHPGIRGTIKTPVLPSPLVGTMQTDFTVTWAAERPPPGFDYDIQIKRPGQGGWTGWLLDQRGASAAFTPDAGPGTYAFRARYENNGTGEASGWSNGDGTNIVVT